MTLARLPLARAIVLLLLFGATSIGLAAAQNPQPPDPGPEQAAERDDADDGEDGDRRGRRDRDGIKPYEEVITEEAETDDGVFTVHRLDDKVFYEIPEAELGKEFLWVSQIARTTEGVGYGGQALGNRVVKWERHGDRCCSRASPTQSWPARTVPSPRPSARPTTTPSSRRSTSRRSRRRARRSST